MVAERNAADASAVVLAAQQLYASQEALRSQEHNLAGLQLERASLAAQVLGISACSNVQGELAQ